VNESASALEAPPRPGSWGERDMGVVLAAIYPIDQPGFVAGGTLADDEQFPTITAQSLISGARC